MSYGIGKETDYSHQEAIDKVTEELKKEGFGVLTSIDVKNTLKQKIDVDFTEYTILGACNPKLAHKGLQAEEELGLLLPCNVIVYTNKSDKTVISAFDPMQMMKVIDNSAMGEVASEVQAKMKRVIEAV